MLLFFFVLFFNNKWSVRLGVRTALFHRTNTGSNPVPTTTSCGMQIGLKHLDFQSSLQKRIAGSNPVHMTMTRSSNGSGNKNLNLEISVRFRYGLLFIIYCFSDLISYKFGCFFWNSSYSKSALTSIFVSGYFIRRYLTKLSLCLLFAQ